MDRSTISIFSKILFFFFLPSFVYCDCGKGFNGYGDDLTTGNATKPHDAPWHVAVYRREVIGNRTVFNWICDGSIITPTLILSAAQCYYDHRLDKPISTIDYVIVVGKYTADYFKVDDVETKEFKISRVYMPDSYHGFSSTGMSDIALVEINGTITMSNNIMPVCIDMSVNDTVLQKPDRGKVTGWDLSATESGNDVLRVSDIYLYNKEKCRPMVPISARRYMTIDKICAGRDPESKVVLGFGGSTLVYRQNGLYYAYGIVSLKERKSTSLILLTRIPYHIEWIKTIVSSSEQILPQ